MTPEEKRARKAANMRAWVARKKAADPEGWKAARKAMQDRYVAKNRDALRERDRKRRVESREEYRERQRRYRNKHKDKINARIRAYRAKRRVVAKTYPAFGEMRTRELMRIDIYAAARRALPRGLPDFIRDDVITEIVLAYLEGEIRLDEVNTRAAEFLRRYRRDNDQWKTVSLDAVIPGTDGLRLIDTLAAQEN